MNYLWKVTAKRNVSNQVAAGMWVEIVKRGTNARPNNKEIAQAFNEKYSLKISDSCCGTSCFESERIN